MSSQSRQGPGTPIYARLRCQVCGREITLAGTPGRIAHDMKSKAWRFLANGRSLCPKCRPPKRAKRVSVDDIG